MKRRTIILAVAAAGLAIASLALPARRPLVWNVTHSVPTGLYLVGDPAALAVDDRVAIEPPAAIQRLLAERGYALQPAGQKGAEELYNTDGVAVADNLAGAPKDYGQVPKLGPPLPGDLGKPILDARQRGDVAALPPAGTGPANNPAADAPAAARQRAEQEREAARGSRVFFGGGSLGSAASSLASLPVGGDVPTSAPGAAPSSDTARRQAFLERASDRRTVSGERLVGLWVVITGNASGT